MQASIGGEIIQRRDPPLAGNRYFVGRMGAARLVLLKDNNGAEPNVWQLFTQAVQEPHKPPAQAAAPALAGGHVAGAGGMRAEAEVLRAAAAQPGRGKLKLSFGEKPKPINGERRVPPLDDFAADGSLRGPTTP